MIKYFITSSFKSISCIFVLANVLEKHVEITKNTKPCHDKAYTLVKTIRSTLKIKINQLNSTDT